MSTSDELHQQLWDLVYGLLDEDEAQLLRERISSEPLVARAYAEVKLQTELVRDALRHQAPPLKLRAPRASDQATLPTPTKRSTRWAGNWVATALAASLLLLVGYTYWPLPSPGERATVASDAPIRTLVMAPAAAQRGLPSRVNIVTDHLDDQPVPADVETAVVNENDVELWRAVGQTDDAGNLYVDIPATAVQPGNRLRVRALGNRLDEAVEAPLRVTSAELATYVATDRPVYEPGETMYFRSVTAPRLAATSSELYEELEIRFAVQSPHGTIVEELQSEAVSVQGVGGGQFTLPEQLGDGIYQLVATNPDEKFVPSARPFVVRSETPKQLDIQLTFDRQLYQPAETVTVDVQVRSLAGQPAADAEVAVTARVDDRDLDLAQSTFTVTADGACQLRFDLPAEIQQGDGLLAVTATTANAAQSVVEPIPITTRRVRIQLFPEGGWLVADVPNRVYLAATDPQDRPVSVVGQLVDSQQQAVADFTSEHEGRGMLQFIPRAGETYQAILSSPTSWDVQSQPLACSDDHSWTFNAGSGVVAAGEPLRLDLYGRDSSRPLLLSVTCRGVDVGQITTFVQGDGRPHRVEVPLLREAQGVLRVTLYDPTTRPVQALAERLAFRQPASRLNVAMTAAGPLTAGSSNWFGLRVVDSDDAAAVAGLGVAVVAGEPAERWTNDLPSLPGYFYLLDSLPAGATLDNADLYLSDQPGAARALDLMLGVRGWRQIETVDESRLASLSGTIHAGGTFAQVAPSAAPQVWDNLSQLLNRQSQIRGEPEPAAAIDSSIERYLLPAGVGALVLIGLLAILRLAGTWVWIPSLAVATGALLLGMMGVLTQSGPGRSASDPESVALHDQATNAVDVKAIDGTNGAEAAPEPQLRSKATRESMPAEEAEQADFAEQDAERAPMDMRKLEDAGGQSMPGLESMDRNSGRSNFAPDSSPAPAGMSGQPSTAVAPGGAEQAGSAATLADSVSPPEPSATESLAARDAPVPPKPAQTPAEPAIAEFSAPASPSPAPADRLESAPRPAPERSQPRARAMSAADNAAQSNHRFLAADASKLNSIALEKSLLLRREELHKDKDTALADPAVAMNQMQDEGGLGALARSFSDGQPSGVDDAVGFEQRADRYRADENAETRAALSAGTGGALGFGRAAEEQTRELAEQAQAVRGFELRQFAYQAPSRTSNREGLVNADRPITLLWAPLLPVDESNNATATVEFDVPPNVNSVQLWAAAHGTAGFGELRQMLPTRPALELSAPRLAAVTVGDRFQLPVTLTNNSAIAQQVQLQVQPTAVLQTEPSAEPLTPVQLGANSSTTVRLPALEAVEPGEAELTIAAASESGTAEWSDSFMSYASGQPIVQKFSGVLDGSTQLPLGAAGGQKPRLVRFRLRAYPSLAAELSDAVQQLESQSTVAAAPPTLAAELIDEWLNEQQVANPQLRRQLQRVVTRDRQTPRATSGPPANEVPSLHRAGSTSQLADSKDQMLDKLATAGVEMQGKKELYFGTEPEERKWYAKQRSMLDRLMETKALELENLSERQQPDGAVLPVPPAEDAPEYRGETNVTDYDQTVETTALAALFWQQTGQSQEQAQQALDWLRSQRKPDGGFGSAGATAAALPALATDTNRPALAPVETTLSVRAGTHEETAVTVPQGSDRPLQQEAWLKLDAAEPGQLQLKITGTEQVPYVLETRVYPDGEVPAAHALLNVSAQLSNNAASVGDVVALQVTVERRTNKDVTLVIGIPGGLELNAQDATVRLEALGIRNWSSLPGELVLHWHTAEQTDADQANTAIPQTLTLQLLATAKIPGRFAAQPSRAFTADDPARPAYADPLRVEIK